MREQFVEKSFTDDTVGVISKVDAILTSYARQGYSLSVRQLYYQMVARGHIPNTTADYKRLVRIVGDGRLTGWLDWAHIVDRERPVVYPSHWENVGQIAVSAAQSFRLDRWKDQPYHIEVMVEKSALEGVLIPVCRDEDVRFTANKGYSSLSALYRCGQRVAAAMAGGKVPIILYLGDHDPSGLDMDRDIMQRVSTFSWEWVKVQRLALLMDQVRAMDIPENPAKMSDTRAPAYVAEFGGSSWELDAMEPAALADLVRQAIWALRDDDLWDEVIEQEEAMRAELWEIAKQYGEDADG